MQALLEGVQRNFKWNDLFRQNASWVHGLRYEDVDTGRISESVSEPASQSSDNAESSKNLRTYPPESSGFKASSPVSNYPGDLRGAGFRKWLQKGSVLAALIAGSSAGGAAITNWFTNNQASSETHGSLIQDLEDRGYHNPTRD
jgi:hypothetical protein